MSKAPRVLGTLSIIFGTLTAAWSPLYLLMVPLMRRMSPLLAARPGVRDPNVFLGASQAVLDAEDPYMRPLAIVMTLLSLALIVIGVGLLRRRQWARIGAIVW